MNIFYLSYDPCACARWAVDRHVTKMILEAAQLLSTAHRVLDGVQYIDASGKRKMKRWRLPDHRENILYKATHVNHPCAIWCRESTSNYNWLFCYLAEHCMEYSHRYEKVHLVERNGVFNALTKTPTHLKYQPFSAPPCAMDAKYIISQDPIVNYRNYYKLGKAHLHSWKNREPPKWIKEK